MGDFAPKLAAFWVSDGKCVGAMLESGSPDEVKAAQAVAETAPAVDVDRLKACGSAEEALAMFAWTVGGGAGGRSGCDAVGGTVPRVALGDVRTNRGGRRSLAARVGGALLGPPKLR